MPRGWRPKPTEEEKLEAAKKNVSDIIDHAKIDHGIKYDKREDYYVQQRGKKY